MEKHQFPVNESGDVSVHWDASCTHASCDPRGQRGAGRGVRGAGRGELQNVDLTYLKHAPN